MPRGGRKATRLAGKIRTPTGRPAPPIPKYHRKTQETGKSATHPGQNAGLGPAQRPPRGQPPRNPSQLFKLDTVEAALAKGKACLSLTKRHKSCKAVTDGEIAIQLQLDEMAEDLVKEYYHSFAFNRQAISSLDGGGVYAVTKQNHTKVGASETDKHRRVTGQFGNFNACNAVSLLTAEEVRRLIPSNHWIVEFTLDLDLPALQRHETHFDQLTFMIQVFWAEYLFHACTNCLPGMVCEQFYKTPTDQNRIDFAPLTAVVAGAVFIFQGIKKWSFLHTWKTIIGNLYDFARQGAANIGVHLPPQREDEYPKNNMFMRSFGKDNVEHVLSALDISQSKYLLRIHHANNIHQRTSQSKFQVACI